TSASRTNSATIDAPSMATQITTAANSTALFDRSRRVSPGGVHSPVRAFKSVGGTPLFFRGAAGAILTSFDGRDYIDLCQSFGPLMLGHRDAEVGEVVREAIDT